MQEFIDRTGFIPTPDEYKEIEDLYYKFDGDKDAFCKAFNAQEIIARRAEKISELQKQVASLQTALDKELGWKPCKSAGTSVSQEEYLRLAKGNKPMTDEEAKELICGEFGFDKDKIVIIRGVRTYEVNKYGGMRTLETFHRDPYYESTDWFYVRFNVKGYTTWQWEADGLNLRSYCS